MSASPRVFAIDEWPEEDERLWNIGLISTDILGGHAYAQTLRPVTLRNSARGYGRWISFLHDHEPEALDLDPADRVKPARIRLYLKALQESGNTNNTINARFWQLRSALRIMRPERRDFIWLNKPGGRYLAALLPPVIQPKRVVAIQDWHALADKLIAKARTCETFRQIELFRNGLLIKVFATRAPRLRSMASLRIGHNFLSQRGGAYRIAFKAEDMKGRKPLQYDLPPDLTPLIDRYLQLVRPILLAGKSHDWFWVNVYGDRLADIGIEGIIVRASRQHLGAAMRPHQFRKSLATSALIADPKTLASVAAVLGNSPYVTHRHYDLGGQYEAASKWTDVLEKEIRRREILC